MEEKKYSADELAGLKKEINKLTETIKEMGRIYHYIMFREIAVEKTLISHGITTREMIDEVADNLFDVSAWPCTEEEKKRVLIQLHMTIKILYQEWSHEKNHG